MSIDQDTPEEAISAETEVASEIVNEEQPHTEVAEHEYTIEELKKELEEAKQKNHEAWDKSVRVQAEMENLKRRTQKDLCLRGSFIYSPLTAKLSKLLAA